MKPDQPNQRVTSPLVSMLRFCGIDTAFLAVFVVTILSTTPQARFKRIVGVVILAALTHMMESVIVLSCTTRPQWVGIAAALLWVQFLSASEILQVSRVHIAQLSPQRQVVAQARSAVGLLWNVRRIGTRWQVKNVPSVKNQGRAAFILRRLAATIVAYLFVDIIVLLPPTEPALLHPDKSALFPPHGLGMDDFIFRIIATALYWLIMGILNLFMTNVGAIFAVLAGFSAPADHPPLYGSFTDAYTIRRFWGQVHLSPPQASPDADINVQNLLASEPSPFIDWPC